MAAAAPRFAQEVFDADTAEVGVDALAEYFFANDSIDESRVFGEGNSGGEETMLQIMGKRFDLFTGWKMKKVFRSCGCLETIGHGF